MTTTYPNGFLNRTSWYAGLSAYWFATSFKWFILLLVVLPGQVQAIVPGGEKGKYWGMVFAIGAAWAIVGPSIFGYLSDRTAGRSRSPWIGLGSALTVIGLMLLMGANHLWTIVLGYLLLQLADDVGTGPYSALIPEVVPEEHRGRASGWMGIATSAGQVAVGLLAIALGGDVQAIYISIAVVNVLSAIAVILTLRGVKPLYPAQPDKASLFGFVKGWVKPWRTPDFFWVWFTRFLNAFGFYLVVNYLRYYMSDSVRTFSLFGSNIGSEGMATNVLALTISLTGIAGALIASKFSDSWGRKKVIYVSGLMMSAAIVPCALIPNYTLIWSLALLFGSAYGMYLSADWALVSDVLPDKDSAGTDMGVWQMSVAVVQIFTGAVGSLIDWGNRLATGRGYVIAFILSSILFFLSTVLIRQVKGSR